MTLAVAEVFANRARRVGRNVQHRRGFGRRGSDDNGVFHCASVFQNFYYLRNGRALLPDRVVNTDEIVAFAVDDGVNGNGGLSGLAVADDEFALAAANRNHAVDGLESSRHRLAHGLTVNDAGGDAFQRKKTSGGDRAFAVDGLAEGIHYATHHGVAHRYAHDATSALNLVAFFNLGVIAEQHDADLIFFQVHGDARQAMREAQQFTRHHLVEAMYAGNTVAQRNDCAHFVDCDLRFVVLDLIANQLRNFVCLNLCHSISLLAASLCFQNSCFEFSSLPAAHAAFSAVLEWNHHKLCCQPALRLRPAAWHLRHSEREHSCRSGVALAARASVSRCR